MRIIAGKYKRRIIRTIEGTDTRPVMDRIKESIFNILVHRFSIVDSEVLDLFAGSGAFGLEALSRGAKSATFVEKSFEAVKYLQENITNLKCADDSSIKNTSVEHFLETNKKKFDLIFCDPPFKMENPMDVLQNIRKYNALSEDSLIIFRSEEKNTFIFEGFEVVLEKVFGRNIVYFLRKI
jgi:16S rRNA (guanine966-N2)-methyltransferase